MQIREPEASVMAICAAKLRVRMLGGDIVMAMVSRALPVV